MQLALFLLFILLAITAGDKAGDKATVKVCSPLPLVDYAV